MVSLDFGRKTHLVAFQKIFCMYRRPHDVGPFFVPTWQDLSPCLPFWDPLLSAELSHLPSYLTRCVSGKGMLEASVLPSELLTVSVDQIKASVFEMVCVYTNHCLLPLFTLKSAEMKDNREKRGQKSFYFIRKPKHFDTARRRALIQSSPTLNGERYHHQLETTVGAWPKSFLHTAVAHCARPQRFSSYYVFSSPRGRLVKKPFVWHSVFKPKLW